MPNFSRWGGVGLKKWFVGPERRIDTSRPQDRGLQQMSYLSAADAVVRGASGSGLGGLPGADWSPPPALIVATFLLAGILRWLVWASRPRSSPDDRRSHWWRSDSSAELPASEPAVRWAAGGLVLFGLTAVLHAVLAEPTVVGLLLTAGVGTVAMATGAVVAALPWGRWPYGATLVLPPVALALVTAGAFGGLPGALQGVFVVLVLAWVGAAHAPGTSLYLAPLAAGTCALPDLSSAASAAPAASVFVVVPAGLVVAEVMARARSQAERRGQLLARLAHAGRMVTTAPTTELAATLTGAAADLGFDVSCLLLLNEDSKSYVVCGARGLDGVVGSVVRASEGLFGVEPAACLARRAVVAEKYRDWPFADDELIEAGIRCAVAAPLSVGGIPVGVLAGAKRKASKLTTEEIDAFEVLALQGGLGFETQNRRRAALEAVSL